MNGILLLFSLLWSYSLSARSRALADRGHYGLSLANVTDEEPSLAQALRREVVGNVRSLDAILDGSTDHIDLLHIKVNLKGSAWPPTPSFMHLLTFSWSGTPFKILLGVVGFILAEYGPVASRGGPIRAPKCNLRGASNLAHNIKHQNSQIGFAEGDAARL